MYKKWYVLLAVLVAGAMLFAACAPAAAPAEEPAAPIEEPAAPVEEPAAEEVAEVSGDVLIDGSSTVYPITVAVAEEFAMEFPDVRVSVGMSGTGGGFDKFCIGETDINNASRPIDEDEAQLCAENNVEFVEFLVGMDGLTVMVNPENDWLESLNTEQLGQIFGVNSTVVSWSDIDPAFPDETIKFFIPDPGSGTRDYMVDIVEDAVGDGDLRYDENTTFSTDDNVLLVGIAEDPNAIGFFGYAFYVHSADRVRAIPIVNEDGIAVLPSDVTVQDGSYNPLSRPLYFYVNLESLLTKPQVVEFGRFFFSDAGGPAIMTEVGYSMPPDGTYEENLTKLLESAGQ